MTWQFAAGAMIYPSNVHKELDQEDHTGIAKRRVKGESQIFIDAGDDDSEQCERGRCGQRGPNVLEVQNCY